MAGIAGIAHGLVSGFPQPEMVVETNDYPFEIVRIQGGFVGRKVPLPIVLASAFFPCSAESFSDTTATKAKGASA